MKLFLDDDASVDHEALIRTFHGWIRDKVIDDELAIDVADYGHVPDGPGIVLIGHHSDYYVDEAAPKGGLIFSRKRGGPEGTEASIADAFTRALKAAKTLEADDTLKLGFGAATIQVKAMDRLNAPNDDAGWAAIEPALASAAKAVFGDGATVARDSVADREPLTATVTTGRSERAAAILA